MTTEIELYLHPGFFLPVRVSHPTILYDPLLFHKNRAEQVGRAEGWRPAQARRVGVHNPSENMNLKIMFYEDKHAKHALPKKRSADNDIMSNNDINTDKNIDNIKDGIEDVNHNGRIDGDNGDDINSVHETWYETNPNNRDSDGDGFDDGWEIEKGYNPKSIDTDQDNIPDNEEDINENGFRDGEETDAKLKDTDGDGLNDHLEKLGWTIIIYREATMEKMNDYITYSDPNKKDSDNDGMNDFEEFQNQTDPNKNDTDGDGFLDLVEIQDGTLPIGREGIPPSITHYINEYALRTRMKGIKLVTEVILKIWIDFKDNYYMEQVCVKVAGIGELSEYTGKVKKSSHYFEWKLDYLKAVSALFNSYNINISAIDKNENLGFIEKQSRSIMEFVYSEILRILNDINEGCDIFEYILKSRIKEFTISFFQMIYDDIDMGYLNLNMCSILTSSDENQYWTYSIENFRDGFIPNTISLLVNFLFGDISIEAISSGIGISLEDWGLYVRLYFGAVFYQFKLIQHVLQLARFIVDPISYIFYIFNILDWLGLSFALKTCYLLNNYPAYVQYEWEGGCALTSIRQAYDWLHLPYCIFPPINVYYISYKSGYTIDDMQDGLSGRKQYDILDSLGIAEKHCSFSDISMSDIKDEIGRERDPIIFGSDGFLGAGPHTMTIIGYLDLIWPFVIIRNTWYPFPIIGIWTLKYIKENSVGGKYELRFVDGGIVR